MKSIPLEIRLQTNDDTKVLRFVELEKFDDGSGYRCRVIASSGGFSCDRPFYFDDSSLPTAVARLQHMEAGQVTDAIIKGEREPDHVGFHRNALGHVIVSGELYEQSELPQSIKFCFKTDQTILAALVRDLRMLLNG